MRFFLIFSLIFSLVGTANSETLSLAFDKADKKTITIAPDNPTADADWALPPHDTTSLTHTQPTAIAGLCASQTLQACHYEPHCPRAPPINNA